MMLSDFTRLDDSKNMLEWFSENPYQDILDSVEDMFVQQSASTQLLEFKISSEPEWLTGGRSSEDPNKIILVRSGFAAHCDFSLQDDSGIYDLTGIFTWVATHLDQIPITKMWMDLDGNMQTFGKNGVLAERIYTLD